MLPPPPPLPPTASGSGSNSDLAPAPAPAPAPAATPAPQQCILTPAELAAAYAALPPLHCPPAPPPALNPAYGHAQEVEHNDWEVPDQHPVSISLLFH